MAKRVKHQKPGPVISTFPEYILLTNLIVPARQKVLVHRERLLASLHANTERRLILVSAPAGFGKTTLLTDFAHDTTLPVCWYSVDPAHSEEKIFAEYLTSAILRQFPRLKKGRAVQWMDSGRPWERVGFLTALINDIQDLIDDYFLLIIDDFHLLENNRAVSLILDWFLERVGDNCCLLLSTRGIPELSFLQLTAHGQIFALGGEDLRFTPQEIQALYTQRFSVRLPDEEARQLAELSGGWIIGLLLSTQRMWRGAREAFLSAKAKGVLLFEYLVKEVLEAQEPEVQDFLLRSSVLPELTPAFCDEVLGINKSAQMLSLIERRNLFISLVDEKERVYHYHHLLKEFLTQSLRSQSRKIWKDLHFRTGQALGARGRWEEALGHLISAGAFENATRILEDVALRFLQEGRLMSLSQWIDRLPKRLLASRPYLLLARSAVAIDTGETTEAKRLSRGALRRFRRNRDTRGAVRALVQLATLERSKGNFSNSIAIGKKALKLCRGKKQDPSLEAQVLRTLGIGYGTMGGLPKSIVYLRRSLDLYLKTGDETRAAYVATSLGEAFRRQGNLLEADRYSYLALEKWQSIGNQSEESRLLNNLAVSHYYEGDFQRSLELFEDALAKAVSSSAPAAEGNILAGMGDIYREWGMLAEAKEKYQAAIRISRKIEDASLLLYATDGLAETCRREGNLPGARSYLQRALEILQITGSRIDKARVHITMGLLEVDIGNMRLARRELLEAKSIAEQSRASGELARAIFSLATCDLVSGRINSSLSHLQAALKMTKSMRVEFFLLNPRASAILQLSADKGIMPDYATELLGRIEATSTLAPVSRPLAEPAPKFGRLEVRALGGGQVWINGKEVPRQAWRGRQARELFFLLLDRSGQTRDEIGVVFWPDLTAERMKSVFHATVHHIRKALQGEWIHFNQVRGWYEFNQEMDYWYDVQAFERALATARRRRSEPSLALPEYRAAIDLYQGEFLPEVDAEWADQKREALARSFIDALLEAADILLRMDEPNDAANYLSKAYEREPYREDLLRKAMVALALGGRKSEAIELYQTGSERLHRELGMGVSSVTIRLAQELRQGQYKTERLFSYLQD